MIFYLTERPINYYFHNVFYTSPGLNKVTTPAIPEKFKEGTTLAFEIPKQIYSGSIKTVTIGKGEKAMTLGGEKLLTPFMSLKG